MEAPPAGAGRIEQRPQHLHVAATALEADRRGQLLGQPEEPGQPSQARQNRRRRRRKPGWKHCRGTWARGPPKESRCIPEVQYTATPEDRLNHCRTNTFLLATGIFTRESGPALLTQAQEGADSRTQARSGNQERTAPCFRGRRSRLVSRRGCFSRLCLPAALGTLAASPADVHSAKMEAPPPVQPATSPRQGLSRRPIQRQSVAPHSHHPHALQRAVASLQFQAARVLRDGHLQR